MWFAILHEEGRAFGDGAMEGEVEEIKDGVQIVGREEKYDIYVFAWLLSIKFNGFFNHGY